MFRQYKKIVLWSGMRDLDSFRHIHRHYYEVAHKLGIPCIQVQDSPAGAQALTQGSVVFAVDVWSAHLPYVPGVDYVLHNFDGSHPVCMQAPPENVLRLQVWTYDSFGEEWDKCRQFSKEQKILFQPWGTNLLAEEFMDPICNPGSREAIFVGAVWRELYRPPDGSPAYDLGNEQTINYLRQVFREKGLDLRLLTQISDQENVDAVRAARLAPAVAGGWQVEHGYLPCRCFKNPSYGVLMFTNIPKINELFEDAVVSGNTLPELVSSALKMKGRSYEELVRAQQKIAARYSYRESLESISRALEEIKT